MIEGIINFFMNLYNGFVGIMPENLRIIPPLILIMLIIALYSIFIWFFYRFLARRDVIKANLSQYNKYENPFLMKFFAAVLYTLEFIIITPIVIFFWFSVLTILLIILAKEIEVGTVILISAGFISAIRFTAYFNEDLSKDLSKMFPFTLLGIAILTPGFFNVETTMERFLQIPHFFDNALYYFLFIVALEIILRLFFLLIKIIRPKKTEEIIKKNK